jgi:hypothetical protein
MAGDDQPLNFQTSQEESVRQAEAAFGGSAPKAPDALPVGASVATPVGVPGARRQRHLLRRAIVAFVLFDLVAGVILGGFLIVKSAVDDATNPGRTIPSLPGVPSVPGIPTPPGSPATPARPAASSSNFTVAGLARSKATAQKLAGRGARIELARVAQDQLQVIARNGSTRKIVIVSDSNTRAIDTPAGALTGNEFGFEAFSPAALARLLSGLRRGYRVSASRIDYIVLLRNPVAKDLEWLVYPKDGSGHFQADARGGSLRRIG